MKKTKWLIVFILLFTHHFVKAQIYFEALVKDSLTQEPLIGAIIIEQGTNNGTLTDLSGRAKLAVTKTGNIHFTIQYIGYNQREITVKIPQTDSIFTIFLIANQHQIDEVTITSTRTNSRIEEIPTRVEVLGIDEMNEENGIKPGNIMSLLGDIAGIQLQQVSASTGSTYARIQGLDGRYTQLLKDGMPLFGGLSGNFSIMQIPPLDLEQIEIIKGSVSTLYGGDAIGGIINLVSKKPPENRELSITLNQTSLLETNANIYSAKRYKKFGFTFFAGQTYQKERDLDKDGLSDVAQVNSTIIHPKLVFYLNPKSTLTLNYSVTFDTRIGGNMNYFKPASSDTIYHVSNNTQRNSADTRWLYEFSKTSNLSLKISSSYVDQVIGTKYYTFNATQWVYYSEISFFKKIKKTDLVAGINFNGDVFTNKSLQSTDLRNYNYRTVGTFVQSTWNPIEKFTIESGLRIDSHSKFGLFMLPRLAFMYKINHQFTARINGGLGYKIPNMVTYINPETDLSLPMLHTTLNPELSQGINADLNFHQLFFDKLNVTINQTVFFTNISQPIYNRSLTETQIWLVNAGKPVQTRGLQTYVRVKYIDAELYLGYVFTDVVQKYATVNKELAVTPKHNLSATMLYEFSEHWKLGMESSLIAGQVDEFYHPVKNYFLIASMLQYNIRKVTIVLNGENLLDFRQYRFGKIYSGTIDNPVYHKLWAPIDGRVINLSMKFTF